MGTSREWTVVEVSTSKRVLIRDWTSRVAGLRRPRICVRREGARLHEWSVQMSKCVWTVKNSTQSEVGNHHTMGRRMRAHTAECHTALDDEP